MGPKADVRWPAGTIAVAVPPFDTHDQMDADAPRAIRRQVGGVAGDRVGTVSERQRGRSVPPVALARLAPPRARGAVVRRERLFQALDHGRERPLTVITGPPGAGKTVLLSSWLSDRRRRGRVAWLGLGRPDCRPTKFWNAVLDAVDATVEPLTALRAELGTEHNDFLAALGNAIAGLHEPLVLILDDFQELRGSKVCDELDELLRHPPEKLRLVIASRADPRLSLHRLKLEGRLEQIRTADLAFTRAEARELFELAGVDVSDDQLRALHERTEGWAAGLRLAAMSLEAGSDAGHLVDTFAGDESSVADYLVEEVLDRQSRELREFMLQTSVVELVSAELADALTRRRDGGRVLESLERSHAFIAPVDEHREWYRYHPLFAGLLRSELRHRMPDAFALQHRRAAHWYASNAQPVAAARHAIAAGDWDLAADLLSAGWLTLLLEGESAELADLLADLPRDVVSAKPEVAIAAAGALLESGEPERARECIRSADANACCVKPAHRADFSLSRAVVALLAARAGGDFRTALASARKLLAMGGPLPAPDRRALALVNLGAAQMWIETPARARRALKDGLALAEHGERAYLELSALGWLALLEALSGSLRHAATIAERAIGLAEPRGWVSTAACASAHLSLGVCAYRWGEVGEAQQHAERARGAARAACERSLLVLTEILRARIAHHAGDVDRAELSLREARQEAGSWEMPRSLEVELVAVEASVLAAAGRAAEAASLLDNTGLGPWAELELVRARLALAEGAPEAAVTAIRPALEEAVPSVHAATAVGLHGLAAVAEHQRRRDDAALEHVEHALRLAEPDGHRQMLLEVGAPLRDLLARRIRAGTSHRALAGDLVDALHPSSPGRRKEGRLLLEPLSWHEERVLRYLPTDLSKAEIGAELLVSENTVRTHVKSIYRKLDVTNRTDAVRRAKSFGLM
jgi:LuxR family transcriptional regulator, maltose regulon positive regulatory protein